jgi:hypothetical protein
MTIPDIIKRSPARSRAETARNIASGLWSQMVSGYNNGLAQLWHPSDCTTQEVLQELGTDAAQLFQLSAALRNFINDIAPGTLAEPELPPLVYHDDGRVTLDLPE